MARGGRLLLLLPISVGFGFGQDLAALFERVAPSVVKVMSLSDGRTIATGSGFVVTADGLIVTNRHVVKDGSSFTIETADGNEWNARIAVIDRLQDLAVLRVSAPERLAGPLRLSRQAPKAGSKVMVIGSPLGLEQSVSDGIVSAVRKLDDGTELIQITAPISPGSSGSPVVDSFGDAVGVATFTLTRGENVNFAISTKHVKELLETLVPSEEHTAMAESKKESIPGPKKVTATTDPASLAKGKELLAKVQQALGGADKLAAVKDLQYQANVEVQTPGAVMKVKQTNSYLAPSSMRQDIELPFGKQSVYSDGSAGWMAGFQGMQALPPAVVKQVRGEMFRAIPLLAVSDRDPNRTVNYVGEGTLDISSKDGDTVRLEVDAKTGLPAKTSYQGEGGQGTVSQVFADWRDVDGMKLPFEWTTMQGDRKFATVKIDNYKINSGLTSEVLSKKP